MSSLGIRSPTPPQTEPPQPEPPKVNGDVFFVRPMSLESQNNDSPETKPDCPCIRVIQPLLTYMKFVGLDHTFCRPAFRPFFKIYSLSVLLLQLAAVISSLAKIDPPNEGLTTSTTLKITSIAYFSIGASSTFLLYVFQGKMLQARNAIKRELPEGSELAYHNTLLRISKILVAVTFVFSLLNVFSLLAAQLKLVKMPPMHIFFPQFPYSLLDLVAVWYSQNSQFMAGSILTAFCFAIRKAIIQIRDDMQEKSFGDIFNYQKRYQAMTDATSLLEEAYSLFLLFIYAVSVPLCSFILFTILRGDDIDVLGGAVLLFWGLDNILCLLFVSIPPILLYEQGDALVRSCYQMYNKHVSNEKDIMFLAAHITAAPLAVGAGNFFFLSRAMLLTLFSAILTYFIIIMQS